MRSFLFCGENMVTDNTEYEWRKTSLPSVYVSSNGRIFNANTQRHHNGVWYGKYRQMRVSMMVNGQRKQRSVARLVAEAFVRVPEDLKGKKLKVHHIDGDPRNTAASNLQWVALYNTPCLPEAWSPSDVLDGNEDWRQFRNSHIWVSNMGRVFSAKCMRLTKPYTSKAGYLRQTVRPIGTFFVHRMIAEAFIPESRPISTLEVNHRDGDKLNNSAPNLEWLTPDEHRRHTATLLPRGEMHPNAVLTNSKVSEARALYASGEYTYQAIADMLSCSRQSVTRAICGRTYTTAQAEPVERIDGPDRIAKSEARKRVLAANKEHREALLEHRSKIPKRTASDVLNAGQVMEIRARLQSGDGPQKVADDLGYGIYTVMAIRDGRTYTWVENENSIRPRPGPHGLQRKSKNGLIDRKVVTKDLIENVLRMRFADNMSYADIADRIGMHPGTVKTIACGRHALQKRGLAPTHSSLASRRE